MEWETYESYDRQELKEIFKDRKPDVFEMYTRINPDNMKMIYGMRLYFLKGE